MTKLAQESGLSQQMVSYVEKQKRTPSLDTLLRICGALGIQASEILKKAEEQSKEESEQG